jgi:hypothetical protein
MMRVHIPEERWYLESPRDDFMSHEHLWTWVCTHTRQLVDHRRTVWTTVPRSVENKVTGWIVHHSLRHLFRHHTETVLDHGHRRNFIDLFFFVFFLLFFNLSVWLTAERMGFSSMTWSRVLRYVLTYSLTYLGGWLVKNLCCFEDCFQPRRWTWWSSVFLKL